MPRPPPPRPRRQANTPTENTQAALAQALVGAELGENIEKLAAALLPADGSDENKIAAAARADTQGREKAIAILTALMGQVPSRPSSDHPPHNPTTTCTPEWPGHTPGPSALTSDSGVTYAALSSNVRRISLTPLVAPRPRVSVNAGEEVTSGSLIGIERAQGGAGGSPPSGGSHIQAGTGTPG